MEVCKTYYFEAAHHLPNYKGNCKKLHGHSYKLIVTIFGQIDTKTGMVMDFKKLKKAIEKVCGKYDHCNLNQYFKIPTAENMCRKIGNELMKELKREVRIRLYETRDSYCEELFI